MSEIKLLIGSDKYSGWESISVNKSIDTVSGQFQLSVSEKWIGQKMPWEIMPGNSCRITVDDETMITGYIDKRQVERSGDSRTISLTGRDLTMDMVDCSVDIPPYNWKDITLASLVEIVAAPFGISTIVNESGNTERIAKARYNMGESGWQFIERCSRQLGVLIQPINTGGILLTKAGTKKAVTALVEGKNIKTLSGTIDHTKRFSKYIVKGQNNGFDGVTEQGAAFPEGSATDQNVERYRPKIIISENAVQTNRAGDRAAWSMTTTAAKSSPITVTVPGWRQGPSKDSPLWEQNMLVPIKSDTLKINGEMLIKNIIYSKSPSEMVTMSLISPDAYSLQPDLKKSNGNWGELLKRESI